MGMKRYLKSCNQVYHTTIDPKGPGVVRLHLIPPKELYPGEPWVIIINGYNLLPVQTAWAILIKEFMETLNSYPLQEMTDDFLYDVVIESVNKAKKAFVFAKKIDMILDLTQIIQAFIDIARGKEPNTRIGYLSLAEYANHMTAPHRLDLLVSSMKKKGCYNCNQKCIHCYANDEPCSEVNELSTEDWFKIIDKAKDAMIPQLTFTGGEPTMRDDLVELIEHSSWFVTRLNTNGILLTPELCEKLYKADLDSCQITFYSFDKEIHNKLVGGDHYDETIKGIKNAIAAGLDVSVNTPLCSLNANYAETVKFLHDLGVNYFSCSGLIPTGNTCNENSQILRLKKEEITACLVEAYEFTSKNGCEIAFTSPGWIDDSVLEEMKIVVPSCGACLSNMAIAPNGEVIPCQSWLRGDKIFGNMLHRSWSEIWNDPDCKSIRDLACKKKYTCLLKKVGD